MSILYLPLILYNQYSMLHGLTVFFVGVIRLQNEYYVIFIVLIRVNLIKQCKIFSGMLLQLCLVSILGFILYCITYLPDERTSMQFIGKVSPHTLFDTNKSVWQWQSVMSCMKSNQVPLFMHNMSLWNWPKVYSRILVAVRGVIRWVSVFSRQIRPLQRTMFYSLKLQF